MRRFQQKREPVWVSVLIRGGFYLLALVFFPVTIAILVGYRMGWITWGIGGQAFDPDEIDDEDDINWVRDHEERENDT